MAPNSNPTGKAETSATPEPRLAHRPFQEKLRPILLVLFSIFLFSSAFSIAASQIALGISLFLFVVLVALDRRLPDTRGLGSLYLAWALYVGWLVISALLSPAPLSSLTGLREEWLVAALPMGLYLMRDHGTRSRLLTALAVGVLLMATYGIIQHFTGVHWFKDQGLHSAAGNFRLSGNFSHPLTFGYYVVTASLFLLGYSISTRGHHPRWQWFLLISATVTGLIAAALSNSRGPLLALGVGLLTIGVLSRKLRYAIIGVVAVVALGALLSPGLASEFARRVEDDLDRDNRMGRLYIWDNSLTLIADHPIVGVGPGNFGPAYAELLPADAVDYELKGHAHNDFLNIAANSGLPALTLYLILWSLAISGLWRRSHDECRPLPSRALSLAALVASVAFLAGSMTEAVFADEELRQLVTAVWAFGLAGTPGVARPGSQAT